MPTDSNPAANANWVAEVLTAKLAESIETMAGERPRVESRAVEAEPALENPLWWDQPLSLGPEVSVSIGAGEAAWLAIGKHVLAGAGIESSEPAEARSTYLEITSQALSGLAREVSGKAGKTVSCENGAEAPEAKPGGIFFDVEITLANSTDALILRLSVSPALLEALVPQEPTAVEVSGSGLPEHSAHENGVPMKAAGKGGGTLELLMEVELPVSVSFGRADLALKDVLKLTTGSIIELNRVLTEPVEVIVNNCVIARGEVVVIDGNYGVRIQEILSRDKRLRTLR